MLGHRQTPTSADNSQSYNVSGMTIAAMHQEGYSMDCVMCLHHSQLGHKNPLLATTSWYRQLCDVSSCRPLTTSADQS